jgi:NAD-dependent SIR2 family protein deacetylase
MAGLSDAREWLREAGSVAALTGAGVSAESGIPTFRGPGGLVDCTLEGPAAEFLPQLL